MATFPPKVSDEHRWVALASFTLTEGQARTLASGGAVKLGDHNRVSTTLGCIDCEGEWPIDGRCSAPAAPEMDDRTSDGTGGMTDEETNRLLAATDALRRSGAKGLEIGHLEEDVPAALARWYATAQWQGAKVSAEEHASPLAAVEELLARVLVGGGCVKCQRPITLPNEPGVGSPDRCTWTRHRDMWVPGCVADDDIADYIAERKRHR